MGRAFLFFVVVSLPLLVYCVEDELPNAGPVADYVWMKNGKVMANLTASKESPTFVVEYEVPEGKNKTKKMTNTVVPENLKGFNRTITGNEATTNNTIIMMVEWKSNDKKALLPPTILWTLTFDLKDKKVSLSEMKVDIPIVPALNFSANATAERANVTFTDPLSKQMWPEDEFFKCASQLKKSEGGVTVEMGDIMIAAFNEKANYSGKFVECTEDAGSTTPMPKTTTAPPEQFYVPPHAKYHCILFQFEEMNLTVSYENTKGKWVDAKMSVPKSATVDMTKSYCSEMHEADEALDVFAEERTNHSDEAIALTWKDGNLDRLLIFTFDNTKNATGADAGKRFTCSKLEFEGDFEDAKAKTVKYMAEDISFGFLGGSAGKSVACSEFNYTITGNNRTELNVDIMTAKIEAFANATTFSSEETCPRDKKNKTSDLIPIIVGACLAALVVIVLVAYLIGRARARRTGYESV